MEIVRITISPVQPATKTPPKRQQFHLNDVQELSGRGWHLIYVRTPIWVALTVLRTPYVDRVYRENLDMGWFIFIFPY